MAVVGTNDWNAVAYGNGRYVAVGGSGYVTTSTDGKTWTNPKQIVSNPYIWYGVTYANGKFVVCGQYSYIAVSTNGTDWSTYKVDSTATFYWRDVAYGSGKYVVVGGSGRISTSVNGTTWTTPTWFDSAHDMLAVVYANGKYVLGGSGGVIATSVNGTNWSKANSISNIDLTCGIAYGQGLYVAVGYTYSHGYILSSNDGISWTMRLKSIAEDSSDCPITFVNVIYDNELFIAVGYKAYNKGSYVTTSSNGITWSKPVQLVDESKAGVTANVNAIILLK